jgi:hypothetical protein
VLNASVEKTTCVLEGGDHCVFVITPRPSATVPLGDVLSPPAA